MTTNKGGTAELIMIADEPIDERHLRLAVKLAGQTIEFSAVKIGFSGRYCTWPLQIDGPSYTSIDSVGSHLYYIAGYLHRNRETVDKIHALGCNLQLDLTGVSLSQVLSMNANTLKRLGDLEIQLELRA